MNRPQLLTALLVASLVPLGNPTVNAESLDSSTTVPTYDSTASTERPLLARDVRVIHRVDTRDPVVFITFDDGFTPTSELGQVIARHKVPITTFVMPRLLTENEAWFSGRRQMTFENHSVTHGSLTRRSLRTQKKEICRANDEIKQITGERPTLFRPPGGNFTATTKKALAQCGMRYLVMWSAIAEKDVLYIPAGGLRPGDIVLLHYIPSAATTLETLLVQIKKDGLKPALLRDYLDTAT